MDGQESFAEFGSAVSTEGEEGSPSAADKSHIFDFEMDDAKASDGDGSMLGRVLIYSTIVTVVAIAIIWKRFQ